jgi:ATP-dependent Clp protease ATP-binding subunit ClpA
VSATTRRCWNIWSAIEALVFGQDKAIEVLSRAMKLSRAGLRDPDKPIGSFLFSGPTGVGKTESRAVWPRSWAFRCNASTCRNIWSAFGQRLIGAPPGYVGLTRAVC